MVGNGIKAKVAAAIAQDEGGHAQRHPSDQVEEMHVEVQQVVSDEQPHRHRAYCQREYRSEEHTSELQSLMRISYAVFCLKKKTTQNKHQYSLIITYYNKQ